MEYLVVFSTSDVQNYCSSFLQSQIPRRNLRGVYQPSGMISSVIPMFQYNKQLNGHSSGGRAIAHAGPKSQARRRARKAENRRSYGEQSREEMSGKGEERTRRTSTQSTGLGALADRLIPGRFNVSSGGKDKRDSRKGRRGSGNKKLTLDMIDVPTLREWEGSFASMLHNPDGMELFEDFLKTEFSEENIQFWKACERYKKMSEDSLSKEAETLYDEYISPQAPKLVNIDHQTTREIMASIRYPTTETFAKAQHSIYLLMARDSFVRFVKSDSFQASLKR